MIRKVLKEPDADCDKCYQQFLKICNDKKNRLRKYVKDFIVEEGTPKDLREWENTGMGWYKNSKYYERRGPKPKTKTVN